MTEWRTRPTSLRDGDLIYFPGGYEYVYEASFLGRGRYFLGVKSFRDGDITRAVLGLNAHVLRQVFGDKYVDRVNQVYGYANNGGDWPEANTFRDLLRLVQVVWDALEPVIKTREDLEALYG